MPDIHKSEQWCFKKRGKNGKGTFAVFKHINVVGWMFDDCKRGSSFLELSALRRRPLGYVDWQTNAKTILLNKSSWTSYGS